MTLALFVIPALLSIAAVPISDNGNVSPTLGNASPVLRDHEICQQDVLRYEADESWAQRTLMIAERGFKKYRISSFHRATCC